MNYGAGEKKRLVCWACQIETLLWLQAVSVLNKSISKHSLSGESPVAVGDLKSMWPEVTGAIQSQYSIVLFTSMQTVTLCMLSSLSSFKMGLRRLPPPKWNQTQLETIATEDLKTTRSDKYKTCRWHAFWHAHVSNSIFAVKNRFCFLLVQPRYVT